jgi:hypothetical protein
MADITVRRNRFAFELDPKGAELLRNSGSE